MSRRTITGRRSRSRRALARRSRPAEGIRGNSHMLMMDRNSDEIAARIQQWLRARNLMK